VPPVLTINGLVFDCRDIDWDSTIGTQTIPVRLGQRNTIYLLVRLAVALVLVSVLGDNERICESVPASGVSRRQCRIILCGNQPDLSDDDQCPGRPITSGLCGRRNHCSSMSMCSFNQILNDS